MLPEVVLPIQPVWKSGSLDLVAYTYTYVRNTARAHSAGRVYGVFVTGAIQTGLTPPHTGRLTYWGHITRAPTYKHTHIHFPGATFK